jgi:thiol-disulfide isomerase/thioredoxin
MPRTAALTTLASACAAALALSFQGPTQDPSQGPGQRSTSAPPQGQTGRTSPPRPAAPPALITVGDVVGHTFSSTSALVNGLGIQSLEDLRGKPVLVDFWGTHCPPCIGAAVPASLKLQETFGDDLQVLFVESQGSTREQTAAFAVQQKWMGGRAIWTTEHPFETGATLLPNFVLIGNDGRVLSKGSPLSEAKEIERQIVEQIKLKKSPPSGVHKAVRAAWGEFNKGRYAKAIELARAAEAESAGDESALAAARDAEKHFRARIETQAKRVAWLVDNGYFEEAVDLLDALKKGVKDDPDLERRAGEIGSRLESKEMTEEREAGRALGRLSARFLESGGDPQLARDLEHFAERNKGTKAAERARELARWSRPAKLARPQ